MKFPKDIEKRVFSASAAVSLLLGGFLLGAYFPPMQSLTARFGRKLVDIRYNGLAYLGIRPAGHLTPARRFVDSIKTTPALAAPGVTLVTGLFGDRLGARLYDRSGAVLHEWPVDFFYLFPHRRKYRFDALVHGDWLYPNGDLLVVIDDVGLARISACGEILWRSERGSNHSIDVDDEGYIWTPRTTVEDRSGRFGTTSVKLDRIAKFDPATGELLQSFDIAQVLADAGVEAIVKGNIPRNHDRFHLNDVEILKASTAPAFPEFAPGDIMLSGRNVNAIIIIDGVTHAVKWWRVGPAHRQHDPDFQRNGEITIYDNQTSGRATKRNAWLGDAGRGSRIIAIKPSEYGTRTLYDSDRRNTFYSAYRGKHQVLENGNVLVAESEGGRAFEATPGGRIAWMLVNKYDKGSVGVVMSATRYPESYASIGARCSKPALGLREEAESAGG